MLRKQIYLFLLLWAVVLYGAQNADAQKQAVAALESDELLMGTLGKLTVSVPIPNDTTKVMFPLLTPERKGETYIGLLNDTVELLIEHKESIYKEYDSSFKRYDLLIQAFDSGKYVLPPFEFVVDGKTIKSNSVDLTVLPVKVTADDQIDPMSDIQEPFEVNPELQEEGTTKKLKDSLWWWVIGCGILLLGIILWLLLNYKKSGKLLKRKPLPLYRQALNRLEKLYRQNLPQRGRTKEYYTKLTDILRDYLHRQFGVKTHEKTSTEILQEVARMSFISPFGETLKSVFDTADFVKFAKVKPSDEENERCYREVKAFFEKTGSYEKEGGSK